MKAAVYYKYGLPDVINIAEVEKPIPKDDEVLIRIKAASVNAYDWHIVCAKPFFTRVMSGVFKPKDGIPGADMAGIIEAVGKSVSHYKPGDEVYGCLEGCGAGGLATGAFAEYVCAKETNVAPKAVSLTFEEAAGLPMAAVTALQAVRDNGDIKQGQSVLINGASGGVGMFAVQISKALGAVVTGVCSTGSLDTVSCLGADVVIDYKKEDVVNVGRQFDVIIDVAATLSVKDYRHLLKQKGICIVVGFSTMKHMISYNLARQKEGKTIKLCMANNKISEPLLDIKKLVEAGQLRVVIDRRYSFEEIAEALHYVETGHPKGKVIIDIA